MDQIRGRIGNGWTSAVAREKERAKKGAIETSWLMDGEKTATMGRETRPKKER